MIKSQERSYINAAFVVSLIFIGTILQLVQDNQGSPLQRLRSCPKPEPEPEPFVSVSSVKLVTSIF